MGDRTLLAAALVAAFSAAHAHAGAAAAPCWQRLTEDVYDGRVDNPYSVGCYENMLRHVPPSAVYRTVRNDVHGLLVSGTSALKARGIAVRATTIIRPATLTPTGARSSSHRSIYVVAIAALLVLLIVWFWRRGRQPPRPA